jgi:hypothetical protein
VDNKMTLWNAARHRRILAFVFYRVVDAIVPLLSPSQIEIAVCGSTSSRGQCVAAAELECGDPTLSHLI